MGESWKNHFFLRRGNKKRSYAMRRKCSVMKVELLENGYKSLERKPTIGKRWFFPSSKSTKEFFVRFDKGTISDFTFAKHAA